MSIRKYKDFTPQIHSTAYVDEQSCVIGKVSLAEDVSIWPMATLRGDVNTITIGKRSNVQDGSTLHVTHKNDKNPNGFPLTIGDDVTIGHNVVLHGCTIGNQVLVGMGAIILDGAIIEDNVFIGAGSLVTPNSCLKSGYLYMGSPAKQKRPLSDAEKNFLLYSSKHYVNLKNDY
jgi:carbonic anhydrase/acetyltransferase-like protein (isoleucine patch superfamily)